MLQWFLSKNVLLVLGIVAFAALTGGVAWHNHQKRVAFDKGVNVGKSEVATATLEAAVETAAAEKTALETTTIPASKAEVIERCKRAASCRERHQLK